MKWKELITKNEMPKNYQEAFQDLANKLIFTESTDIEINKENIKAISEKIQQEYIHLYEDLQIERTQDIYNFFGIEKEKRNFLLVREDKMKMSERDFIEYVTAMLTAHRVVDCDVDYYNWGFTPKLAQMAEGLKIGKNCFGTTTFVGSLCKKRGINIDMGITPDHPYVIAYLPDGIYALDGQSKEQKLSGKFEDHGSYKIYRTTEEDDILAKMIMVQNFDNAVLYEILENMEVLRQVSLDKKGVVLPGSYESGAKIASDNKEIVQKINWKDLQSKLFPEISKSFLDHKEEWSQEVSRMASKRKKFYAENIFIDIAQDAQQETSFREQEFGEGQKALGTLFKQYKNEIVQFLKNNVNFNDSVPEDVKNYFTYLKTEVGKQKESEIATEVYDLIENKLFDKIANE